MKKPKMPKIRKRKGAFTKKYKQYQKEMRKYNKWRKAKTPKKVPVQKQIQRIQKKVRQAPTRQVVQQTLVTLPTEVYSETYKNHVPDKTETVNQIYSRETWQGKIRRSDPILFGRIIENDKIMLEDRITARISFYDSKGEVLGSSKIIGILPYNVREIIQDIFSLQAALGPKEGPSDFAYIMKLMKEKCEGRNCRNINNKIDNPKGRISDFEVVYDYA